MVIRSRKFIFNWGVILWIGWFESLKVNERREMCGSICIVNVCNDHLLGLYTFFLICFKKLWKKLQQMNINKWYRFNRTDQLWLYYHKWYWLSATQFHLLAITQPVTVGHWLVFCIVLVFVDVISVNVCGPCFEENPWEMLLFA